MSPLKKLVTYTTVVTTIIWSVGLLATPMALFAASSGDLIKLQCAAGADVNDACKAVYYLGADGKRYVFPNEKTYKTWYSDFSGVMIVSSTEMSSYTIGGNVTYRPGVKLVKITTDPKVYAVADNGTLRWVTTAAIAESLYGTGWASMVEDVSDAFFVNYTVGSDIAAAADYDKAAETSDATTINEDKNLSTSSTPSGTTLSVALASDTPATGLIVGNSIHNLFTKVNFTASADGDIVIDQIKVRRGSTVAADGAFAGIVILDGTTMLRTEDAKTLNADHQATFNKDLTIPAGTTKSFYLAGNMASSLASYAGQIPSLDLYAVTLSGGATVSGTLPIVGNYQQLDGTITVGTLTLANGGNNPTASTQKIGVTNYLVSGVKLTANGTEDFKVTKIGFDQGGSAGIGDVANVDLLVDDAVVATIAAPSSANKVIFDLSAAPITIAKGKTKQFDLQLDIVDGSARTIRFDVEDETDIEAQGQTYGAKVKIAAGTGATADATPFWTAVITTISEGTLRIGGATLTAANVANDSDQVVLGKFEFEAKGEPVVISSLPIVVKLTTSTNSTLTAPATSDVDNITVYDSNGVIVAGPVTPAVVAETAGDDDTITDFSATSTDTITVPVGTNVYTIKGDLSSNLATNDTLVTRITPNRLTAKGDTTGITVTPTPTTGEQTSATMTVKAASLAISNSTTPVASTVVAGSKAVTFANITLDAADSGEDIKITAVKVAIHTTTANPSQTSNWSIFDGTTELATSNDPDSDTAAKTTAGNEATSTFTFSTPLVLTKGTSKTLTVKGDIATAATTGTVSAGVTDASTSVTAKGNTSAVDASITMSASDGQNMTLSGSGTLTLNQHSSTPSAALIPGNTTDVTVAVLNAFASYEDVQIEKIYLTANQVNSGGWDQVKKLYVYNGSTLLKEVTPTSSDGANRTTLLDFGLSPIVIPKDGSMILTFKVDTPNVDYETSTNANSFQGFQLKVTAVGDIVAKGADSGTELAAGNKTVNTANGNNMYLVRNRPTITTDDQLSDGIKSKTLTGGITSGAALYRFKVTADSAGDIGLFRVSFLVTTSTATVTNMQLYTGGVLVGTATTSNTAAITANLSSGATIQDFFLTINGGQPSGVGFTNMLPPIESVITAGASRTYEVRGDINCLAVNCSGSGHSGSVNVQLLGDGAAVGTAPAVATSTLAAVTRETLLYERSFLWTDMWRTRKDQFASSTASNTEQWLNAYLVKDSAGNNLASTSTSATYSR